MSQITLPLDIKSLEVISQRIHYEGNIVFEVKSKNDHSTCHKCGKPATTEQYDWTDRNATITKGL